MLCYVNEVKLVYIYICGEFFEGVKILNCVFDEVRVNGFFGRGICGMIYDLEIYVYCGVGVYICGEEIGFIELFEGKWLYLWIKLLYFLVVFGFYMCLIIVNNVEMFCNVWYVMEMGGDVYVLLGMVGNIGMCIVSLSGNV